MGRTNRYRKVRKSRMNFVTDPQIHHDLVKFLVSHGWTNENRLTVSSFHNTGRGLYAKKNLLENDVIIELPIECMLSILSIENDQQFIELFDIEKMKDFVGQLTFQALLAFYLCHHERLDAKSEWFTYIKTLPKTFSVPYFCKKSELYHLPDNLLKHVVDQNNAIKKNFDIITKVLKNPEEIHLDAFKNKYFACNSRSVYLNWKSLEPLVDFPIFKDLLIDDPKMALAPMLDLLNHSDRAKSSCQLSYADSFIERNVQKFKSKECKLTYQLMTKSSFKKYEQIFINYGTHNNTKLLIEYGFIICDNQMDFLEFSLEDVNNYIKSHSELKLMTVPKHKYKFIRDHNLDDQLYIDLNDGLNHNFQAILAILLLPHNLYNLTQVAFGDELNFDDVKDFAIELINFKKNEFEKLQNGLEKEEPLSESATMCLEYYKETIRFIEKVLENLK